MAPLARYGLATLLGVAILFVPSMLYAMVSDDEPAWVVPVNAPIWGGFRTPENPSHQGVDLGAKRYVPIRAAASGVVVERECNASLDGQPYSCDTDGSPQVKGCGWYIDIHHDGGLDTRYCHMSFAPLVQLGDKVKVGQTVGYVGSSGNSSAPHLHFEVHEVGKSGGATNDNAIDPVPFMKGHGAPLGVGNDEPVPPTPTVTPTPAPTASGPVGPPVDLDGDGETDLAVWRGAQAKWILPDALGGVALGEDGDQPAVGDFDGDGKADLALWRPLDGRWIVQASTGAQFPTVDFGVGADVAVPADFDGDGRTDFAVYQAEGRWLIRYATGKEADPIDLGKFGDLPVAGDFDGDGRSDPAVWRPADGSWSVHLSTGARAPKLVLGGSGDIPAAGDFDGDGTDDFAVWSPDNGVWFVRYATGAKAEISLGVPGDIPVIGDYDGDGVDDLAVWRPSDGRWLVQVSSGVSGPEAVLGTAGDVPASSPQWLDKAGSPWTVDEIRTQRLILAAKRAASG